MHTFKAETHYVALIGVEVLDSNDCSLLRVPSSSDQMHATLFLVFTVFPVAQAGLKLST